MGTAAMVQLPAGPWLCDDRAHAVYGRLDISKLVYLVTAFDQHHGNGTKLFMGDSPSSLRYH